MKIESVLQDSLCWLDISVFISGTPAALLSLSAVPLTSADTKLTLPWWQHFWVFTCLSVHVPSRARRVRSNSERMVKYRNLSEGLWGHRDTALVSACVCFLISLFLFKYWKIYSVTAMNYCTASMTHWTRETVWLLSWKYVSNKCCWCSKVRYIGMEKCAVITFIQQFPLSAFTEKKPHPAKAIILMSYNCNVSLWI